MRLSRAGKLLVPGWNCCWWGEICARCEVWQNLKRQLWTLWDQTLSDRRIIQTAGQILNSTTQQDSLRKGKQNPTAHHCTLKPLSCLTTFEPLLTQFSDANIWNSLLFNQLVKNSGFICPRDWMEWRVNIWVVCRGDTGLMVGSKLWIVAAPPGSLAAPWGWWTLKMGLCNSKTNTCLFHPGLKPCNVLFRC